MQIAEIVKPEAAFPEQEKNTQTGQNHRIDLKSEWHLFMYILFYATHTYPRLQMCEEVPAFSVYTAGCNKRLLLLLNKARAQCWVKHRAHKHQINK